MPPQGQTEAGHALFAHVSAALYSICAADEALLTQLFEQVMSPAQLLWHVMIATQAESLAHVWTTEQQLLFTHKAHAGETQTRPHAVSLHATHVEPQLCNARAWVW